MLSMYLLGIVVAIVVAWILKHTILKSPPPPLVLELPPYRVPNFLNVLHTMKSRSWLFVKRAGTVILTISILLWALMTFPRSEVKPVPDAEEGAAVQAMRETGVESRGEPAPLTAKAEGDTADEGAQLQQSYAGRLGHVIEPLIAPLGFDWKMGIGLVASFAARETIVSTLSIVYNVGKDSDADSPSLIEAVRNAKRPDGTPAWTPLVAVSMMVFFVLACQCMSTIAVVRRETNSWRWPLFMVAYMLVIAYVASFVTYQGGKLVGVELEALLRSMNFDWQTIAVALIIAGALLYVGRRALLRLRSFGTNKSRRLVRDRLRDVRRRGRAAATVERAGSSRQGEEKLTAGDTKTRPVE